MREVPLIVAIDGIDKSGKTTVLPKIKKRLQDTLNVTDDDICIVKFDIAKLT
jgi:thymidylate kinase